MHHLTSKSADTLSDEFHRLAGETKSKAARKAFLHAAKMLNRARIKDFAAEAAIDRISLKEFILPYQKAWIGFDPAKPGGDFSPPRDPLDLRTPSELRLITSSTDH